MISLNQQFKNFNINKDNNYLLFLDTETTGLPKGRYAKPEDISKFNNARLVELCYIIAKEDGTIVETVSDIIKPKDFVIDNNSYAVRRCHKITKEKANKEGKDLDVIFKKFEQDMKKYKPKILVAHNMKFDSKIVLSECYRYKYNVLLDLINNTTWECTMSIWANWFNVKWPKLQDLYEILYKEAYIHQHRALADTEHCMKCYFKMKELAELYIQGEIDLN